MTPAITQHAVHSASISDTASSTAPLPGRTHGGAQEFLSEEIPTTPAHRRRRTLEPTRTLRATRAPGRPRAGRSGLEGYQAGLGLACSSWPPGQLWAGRK